MSKYRGFCYTLNNYTEEQVEILSKFESVYHCFAREVAPTTGTPHIQGYIFFKNPQHLTATAKRMFNAHLEKTNGTPEQNRQYIFGPYEKDGKQKPANSTAVEFGVLPIKGKRNDIERIRDILNEGLGMKGVVAEATSLQQIRIAEAILKYEEPARNWKPRVIWYYGPTETGKSRTAHEVLGPGFYRKTMSSGKWWEGYDAHDRVLIDDIDSKFFPYKVLLDLLDRYETRVECKGGSRQFLAKTIIITTSRSPQEMFAKEDQNGAEILRRIDEIVNFGVEN